MVKHRLHAVLALLCLLPAMPPGAANGADLYLYGGGGGGGGDSNISEPGGGGGGAYAGSTDGKSGDGGPYFGGTGVGGGSQPPGINGGQGSFGSAYNGLGGGVASDGQPNNLSNGGNGGSVSYTYTHAGGAGLGTVHLAGGNGGAGGHGGSANTEVGGDGGAVEFTMDFSIPHSFSGTFTAEGGNGAARNRLEAGSCGGDVTMHHSGNVVFNDAVVFTGGDGRSTFTTNEGARGGNVSFISERAGSANGVTFSSSFTATGGAVGSAYTVIPGTTYAGGHGGAAVLDVTDQTLYADAGFTVTGGAGDSSDTFGESGGLAFVKAKQFIFKGTNNVIQSGAGTYGAGAAEFRFERVTGDISNDARKFTLKQRDGALTGSIDNFSAYASPMELELINTVAATNSGGTDGVAIKRLTVGNGKTLTVSGNGDLYFDELFVDTWDFASANGTFIGNSRYVASNAAAQDFTGGKKLTFYLTYSTPAGATALDATSNPLKIDSTTEVGIRWQGNQSQFALAPGDTITLVDGVDNASGGNAFGPVQVTATGSYLVTFDLAVDTNKLIATYGTKSIDSDGTHNQLMGGSAGFALMREGWTTLLRGFENSQPAGGSASSAGQAARVVTFGTIGGGFTRLQTGSHINMSGVTVAAGAGLRFANGFGETTVGLAVEAGLGSYKTHNRLNGQKYKGDGDNSFVGGALIASHELPGRFFLDASFRAGVARTEYNALWTSSTYDKSLAYYGAHFGFGKRLAVGCDNELEVAVRGIWARQNAGSVRNSNNERLSFDAVNSWRTQSGVRFTRNFTDRLSGFAGAVWEYEFNSRMNGRLDGVSIERTSMQGHTGIGELGVRWKARENVDLTVSGYGTFGKRRGGGGSAAVQLTF